MTTYTAPLKIKAEYNFYSGTIHAPQDGYLKGEEDYDGHTGKVTCADLVFATVEDAVEFLTGEESRFFTGGLDYDGDGEFSAGGTYYERHGEYARPRYRIVSAKTGRTTKAILAAIDSCTILA